MGLSSRLISPKIHQKKCFTVSLTLLTVSFLFNPRKKNDTFFDDNRDRDRDRDREKHTDGRKYICVLDYRF